MPLDINKAKASLEEILVYEGQAESPHFDIKQADKSPANLVNCIQGFLNGEKNFGHIIIGVKEINSEFHLKNALPINEKFIKNLGEASKNKIIDIIKSERRFPETPDVSRSLTTNERDSLKTGLDLIGYFNIKPIDYVNYYKRDIFEQMRHKTANWPSINSVEEQKLIDFTVLPVIQDNDVLEIDETEKNNEYLIVLKVSQSCYSPHQNVDDNIYKIRREKPKAKVGGRQQEDAFTGRMNFEEVRKQTEALVLRAERFEINPIYLVYGSHAQELFDLVLRNEVDRVKAKLEEMPGLLRVQTSLGHNVLDFAAMYGKPDVCNLLLNEFNLSLFRSDCEGRTPLLLTAYTGQLEALSLLIEKDHHPFDRKTRLGDNITLTVAQYGYINIMQYLIEKYKIDHLLDVINYSGWNPLLAAVYTNQLEMVKYLHLKRPELLNGVDIHGRNALQIAEHYHNDKEALKEFLKENFQKDAHEEGFIVDQQQDVVATFDTPPDSPILARQHNIGPKTTEAGTSSTCSLNVLN